jgi:hypothetical protein
VCRHAGIRDASQSLLTNCRSFIPVTQLIRVGCLFVALRYQFAERVLGFDLAGFDNDLTTLNINLDTTTFVQMQLFSNCGWQDDSSTVPDFPDRGFHSDLECYCAV